MAGGPRLRLDLLGARVREAAEALAAGEALEGASTLADGTAPPRFDERLGGVATAFGLDGLDHALLALCLLPELSPRYGRLYGVLHDDLARPLASPGLLARLLAPDGVPLTEVVRRLGTGAPLVRRGVLALEQPEHALPVVDRTVKVADAVVGRVLEGDLRDARFERAVRRVAPPEGPLGREAVVAQLRALLAEDSRLPLLCVGPDAAELLARALGRELLLLDVHAAADAGLVREASVVAHLDGATPCFDGLEAVEPPARAALARALDALPWRALLLGPRREVAATLEDRAALVVEAPAPSLADREAAWAAASGAPDVRDVAAKFRLSVGQIRDAAEAARLAARADGGAPPAAEHLDHGARAASAARLSELAHRLDGDAPWSRLVLPARQLRVLRSISAYLRHRDVVLTAWGYGDAVARRLGLTALFAGESGTGKTFAAQVVAADLGLELFRVDLSTTVSKYVGETEKNLDRVFAAAAGSNAILFFDEADALFGKRSGVSDAHDRYANIEVAYLLQRMEGYEGAVVLATNLRGNIDEAFLRRLDVTVDFPFPEAADRRRIWELVLPAAAPRRDDLDLDFLASRFKLSGGAIRNCSVAAAFLAAEEGEPIGMGHLVRAVALEYGKLGRLTLESDFERFHALVRDGVPAL